MEKFLQTIIKEAGKIAREYFFRGVAYTTKSTPSDFLTEADVAVSSFLVEKINREYPTHHIKSEELSDDINVGAEYEWVIDPIDGTKNFAFGIPFWGVMVAVLQNGQTIMSAVYHPIPDELFFARRDGGAFVNGTKIMMSPKDSLDRAYGLFHRGAPNGPYGDYFERFREAQVRLSLETNASAAAFGCSAALTYLAKGAFQFAAGNTGLDWDYLPTFLICQEAGAIITDSDGNPWQRGRQDFLMGNRDTHTQLLKMFQPQER